METLTDEEIAKSDERFERMKKHIMNTSYVIATQKLFFSRKEDVNKTELIVRLYAPVYFEETESFVCYVFFSHLTRGYIFYGLDEFQAIKSAADLDLLLKLMDRRQCNLYYSDKADDSFYFDDACNSW